MEAIGRLAGGVAHDFNNLLTVIIGGAESALQGASDSDVDLQEDLSLVIEAGERASALTRQLLAFGRRQVMQFRLVRLKDLIEGMYSILQRMIGDQVEIDLKDDCAVGRVSVDPDQMQQVIINLVINARDAMNGKGKILFSLSDLELGNEGGPPELSAGAYVLLSVSDEGNGIEESDLEKIFEPFFTTKDEGQGTGLGLATCHGIISQNRGAMAVSSEVGVGTTFRVYLPVA
jgi:signal transduction histidine kinase